MNSGFIIALAWPEAPVRTAEGPYDRFLSWLNFQKNGFYKAGHAAFLLVDGNSGEVNYYDFGRYISPFKNGRVRSAETDPEVGFNLKATISNNSLQNLEDLITEIAQHKETHGYGTMYAGVQSGINHKKAIEHIKQEQERNFIPYGPFHIGGTNCSRFVAQTIFKSKKGGFSFLFPWYGTPSPLGNIFRTNSPDIFEFKSELKKFRLNHFQKFKLLKSLLFFQKGETTPKIEEVEQGTVKAPNQLPSEKSQWLGGTGAGAWHEITNQENDVISVRRSQANGKEDFHLQFLGPKNFDFKQPFEFLFGTRANKIILSQNGKTYEFSRVSE